MELIKEWLVAIMGASVLAAAAEMLMPESEIKKYTGLVIGIIMLSIIVKPIIGISRSDILVNERIFKEQIAAEEGQLGIETIEWRHLDSELSDRLTALTVNMLGSGYENVRLKATVSYDGLERITVSGYAEEQKSRIYEVIKTFGAVEIIWNG